MLPEATIPKPPADPSALEGPWIMTPLFHEPGGAGPDALPAPRPRRRSASPPGRARRRATPAQPASRAARGPAAARTSAASPGTAQPRTRQAGPAADSADLLAVTAERLRRALWRSFLRYNIAGDTGAAVHAAMNVIEPVLKARDTEILRLSRLSGAARAPGR